MRDIFVSVIQVLQAPTQGISEDIKLLHSYLSKRYTNFEIILVHNQHQLELTQEILAIQKNLSSIWSFRLSSKSESSLCALVGLENCIGDYVILFDQNREPLNLIEEGVELAIKNGHEVIIGISPIHRNFLYKVLSNIYRKSLSSLIDYHVPKNSTSYRLLTRKALNALVKTRMFHQQLFPRISQISSNIGTIEYKANFTTKNLKNVSFFNTFSRSISMIVFNSVLPLRIMSFLGIIGSFLALLSSLYILAVALFKDDVIEGWISSNLFISIFFFLAFLILSFLNEYFHRLFTELANKREYENLAESRSSALIKEERINVQSV